MTFLKYFQFVSFFVRPQNGADKPLSPKVPENDVPDLGRFPANYPRQPTNGRQPETPFPYAPGFGPDIGFNVPDFAGTDFGTAESIPDINVYQHKKTLAQGMMDLALFSANANQLRYVLESFDRHPYYYPSVALIAISLIIQVRKFLYYFADFVSSCLLKSPLRLQRLLKIISTDSKLLHISLINRDFV